MTKHTGRWAAVVSGVVALTLVIAGCGAGPAGEEGGGGDQTLRVAVDTIASEDFDPALYTASQQLTYFPILFQPIIDVGTDGALAPGVAESWESNEDATEWIIQIKPDQRFSNGEVLDAEDAAFTIQRYIAGAGVGAARMNEYIDEIEPDGLQLRIITNQPALSLPYDIAFGEGTAAGFVVPKDYIEEVGDEEFNNAPIGSGPFVLTDTTPGRQLQFARNDDFTGGETAHAAELELDLVPDLDARLNLLRSGEVDIVSGLSGPSVEQIQNDPNLNTFTAEESGVVTLQIGGQGTDTPLSDERVRRALSLAIDRASIVDTLLSGEGAPAEYFGFARSIGQPADGGATQDYDPDQARELLADAGYEDGFTLTLWGSTPGSNFVDAITQGWSDIGINVETQIVDTAALLTEFQSDNGKLQPRVVLVFGPNGHGSRIDVSSLLGNHFQADSTYTQYADEDLEELLVQQSAESDPDIRANIIQEALLLNKERERVIPTWYVNTVFGAAERVTEWEPIAGQGFPLNLQSARLD